jgi:hypothetical protein
LSPGTSRYARRRCHRYAVALEAIGGGGEFAESIELPQEAAKRDDMERYGRGGFHLRGLAFDNN